MAATEETEEQRKRREMIEDIESRLAERERQLMIEDIEERLSAREAEIAETKTPFFDQVGQTFLNNLLAVPSAAGEVLSKGVAGTEAALEGGASVLTGGDFDFERRANRNLELPGFAQLNAIPRPTTQDIEAFLPASRAAIDEGKDIRSAGGEVPLFSERFGPAFDEELARINQEETRIAEKFPNKIRAGEIGGDVLSLVTGRLPFAKGINVAESAFVAKKFTDSMTNPGVRRVVELALDSGAVRALKRGTGRAIETGAEASVLSLLKGGDPLETAAFAAGGQIAGSGILGSIKTAGKHPILSSVVGLAVLIQMSKAALPGGEDKFMDSLELGFDKVLLGLTLGVVSGVAGAGRLRGGNLAKNLPKFTDALATIPRGASISLLQDYLNATPNEQQTIDDILNQLQQDVTFFGPEITDKLLVAMQDGNLTKALRQ